MHATRILTAAAAIITATTSYTLIPAAAQTPPPQQTPPPVQTLPPVVLTDAEVGYLKADVWQFRVMPLGRDSDDAAEVLAEGRIRLKGEAIFFADPDNVKEAEDNLRVGNMELRRSSSGRLEVRLIFTETLEKPDFIKGIATVTYDADKPGGIWNGAFKPKQTKDKTDLDKNYKFELRRTDD